MQDLKTIYLGILLSVFCLSCQLENPPLFNGKDLSGWLVDVPEADSVSGLPPSFIVRDSMLISMGEPRGHLITEKTYQNYRLTVSYRFPGMPGNCGVLVHASTPRFLYKMFPKSIEVQMEHNNAGDFWVIGEDIEVDNMIARRGPKEDWGVTEDKARRILNLSDTAENPLGSWNTMVVECVKDEVKVWINDVLVNHGYHATAQSGKIAIQAEGSIVEIRTLFLEPIEVFSI
jgi:hypothetical protein